jgi:hypothetical protein
MRSVVLLFFFVQSCLYLAAQKTCGTDVYQQQIRTQFSSSVFKNGLSQMPANAGSIDQSSFDQGQDIIIPVVVHVIYQHAGELSDVQIQSQIDILNRDFNPETFLNRNIPQVFRNAAAKAGIRFELARTDPDGRATTGITRRKSSRIFWGNDDKIKDPSYGGVSPWDARFYLNIWVANLVPGLLGYSAAPGSPAKLDGVVIRTDVVGKGIGSFSEGRTAVHEVGHWLNLKHLWGEGNCGTDEVGDTPPQKTYNQGCPAFPRINTSCGDAGGYGEMFMNFMDFTDDACMVMFTRGQVSRMRALFFEGGARQSLLQTRAFEKPWNVSAPVLINGNGNDAQDDFRVKALPQPAMSVVVLRWDGGSLHGLRYTLRSLEGRLLEQGITSGESPTIDLAKFKAGVYILQLTGFPKPVRIIKQ